MSFIRQDPLPTEATVRRELKIMRQGTNELLKSKKTARDFLYKHGFITRDGKLTQRYGGPGEDEQKTTIGEHGPVKNWRKTTLGKLVVEGSASYQTGPFGTTLKASEYANEGVPLISVGEIREGYIQVHPSTPRVCEKTTTRLPKYVLEEEDIVFGRKGAINRNAIIQKHQAGWFLGSDGIRLRLSDEHSSAFISYQLRTASIQEWLMNNGKGAIMPTLNQKILDRLPIAIPPLPTQQKIAKVLATLDAKIALNNRINAELEAMAKLLYDYWFVQFDFPMTAAQAAALGQAQLEGQPYKSSGGKMVFNPTLKREIPEGWEAETLEHALTLCYGKALKKDIQSPGPYPVYGSNGIYGYHDTPLVKGPGIIIGRKGTVGSVTWEHGDFFATDTSYYVETRAHYSMAYAFHLLKSLRLDLMNTDSAVPGLSRTYAYMRTFASPPAELVEAFTEIAAPLRDQIHINQKQNQELTTLRDWLLPMLMNGQVAVK